MPPWEYIVSLVTALGIGTIVPKILDKMLAGFTERGKRRQADAEKLAQLVDEAKQERDDAIAHRDVEASRRRRIEEHASRLRRIIAEAPCIDFDIVPPWPDGTGPVTHLGDPK